MYSIIYNVLNILCAGLRKQRNGCTSLPSLSPKHVDILLYTHILPHTHAYNNTQHPISTTLSFFSTWIQPPWLELGWTIEGRKFKEMCRPLHNPTQNSIFKYSPKFLYLCTFLAHPPALPQHTPGAACENPPH